MAAFDILEIPLALLRPHRAAVELHGHPLQIHAKLLGGRAEAIELLQGPAGLGNAIADPAEDRDHGGHENQGQSGGDENLDERVTAPPDALATGKTQNWAADA